MDVEIDAAITALTPALPSPEQTDPHSPRETSSPPEPSLAPEVAQHKPEQFSTSDTTPITPEASHMNPRTSKPSTPLPPSSDSPSGLRKSPEPGRPLNVTDALSYLDAVKIQFQEKPEVYNQFLDIMKDFKSQVIDTPGVIQRVSRLFNNNKYLIEGFNTFLPMGYRIDVSADPLDPNAITVTTPLGMTIQHMNSMPGSVPHSHVGTPTALGGIATPVHVGVALSRSHTPLVPPHLHAQPQPFDPTFSPGFQNSQTTAAASFLGNMGSNHKNPVETQPAIEFNHAIHYLNKIKSRYSDDPNTYKQFLDILQTYQKEQRHLPDPAFQSQVFVQVQLLFKDAPDLLAEFKDFLPDVSQAGQTQGPVILPQPLLGTATPTWLQQDLQSTPGEKAPKKAITASKRRKRGVEKEITPVPPAKPTSRAKKVKYHHKPDSTPVSFSPLIQPKSPPSHAHVAAPLMQSSPLPSAHVISSQGSSLTVGAATGTSADKLLFFDRAKKSLESREMYEDFLKLLNLFSREIIETKTLVERANAFLGDGDLLAEFKELVGWDDRQENVENGPPGSIRTGPPEALSALPADDGEGPSYRRLPDSEIRLACSGRDELCRSVLNDEWVSHPTWASEEAGFISHKKNSFEEALHKSEEERFEYHVHLEGLARTIAVLEPLNARIEEMTNEERTVFKLKPDFGGPSKSIYHRIIKKVYGRDSGSEVIQALQDCPSVAVPVALARLKQRDEEWRRAQREWSRTWREVDSKNFYKSLDHQGISFKANDKKNITAKYFMNDIESIKNQQLETLEQDNAPEYTRNWLGNQLEYLFEDTSALLDTLKMVFSFLDRSQANYGSQERRSIEKFLRAFVPLLCMYPTTEFNSACAPLEVVHEEESPPDANVPDGSRNGRRSVGSGQSAHTGGVAANDLRRKLLRTAQEKAMGKWTPATSRDVSPTPEHRSSSLSRASKGPHDKPDDIWIKEAGAESLSPDLSRAGESDRPIFVNSTFYTLLRLLQLLYSRLLTCKMIGAQHAAEQHASLLANRVAVELGLDEPNGPSAVLEQAMELLDGGDRTNVVSMYLLNACEKLFEGEMDQATFEEHMRWFFGNKAYHLFTLDRLITALVKQVQTILGDNRCQELWRLMQQQRGGGTRQDVIRYRREAERQGGQDEHLYRLEWVRERKCIRVHVVGADEASVEWDGTAVGRWRGYIDSYVTTYRTEWTTWGGGGGGGETGRVYLRRCIDSTASSWESQTRVRISLPSYKLVFESGAEDVAYRRRSPAAPAEQALLARAAAREEERRKSFYLFT